MSGLAELTRRQRRLHDVRGLMTAMKSLSLVESHKLARFIGHQRRMRELIETVAAEFLHFHPSFIDAAEKDRPIAAVLVGTERGFCGSFNERMLRRVEMPMPEEVAGGGERALFVVGSRLASRLAGRTDVAARLDGATVSEDVPAVMEALLGALQDWRARMPGRPATLVCLAHDEEGDLQWSQLLPMPQPATPPRHADAPRMNLAPDDFHAVLLEQFLLAGLVGRLYASLAAESRERLAHMEQALERLDESLHKLNLRRNRLRQERIIEEIEVMLSTAMATT